MIPSRNRWYRRALAAPHEAYSRVEVWRGDIQVDELAWYDPRNDDMRPGALAGPKRPYTRLRPVYFGGAVRATLGSRVTRTLQLTVPDELYPWEDHDLLNPYGNELRAFRGIRYGNDSPDEFPVFVGRIMKVSPPGKGQCTIQASDNTIRVSGAGFQAPMPSQVGSLVLDEFERLILDVYPNAIFGTSSAITATVPPLAYDQDPGTALDALAKAASAFWYALADGRFVMRQIPWVFTPEMTPINLRDGEGGTLSVAFPDRDANDLYNRVTVISDRPDGGPALWATADDDDPTSPTWIDGPFGQKATSVRVTGASNQGQLVQLAKSLVQRTRARVQSWSMTCVPDASIELGDLLQPTFRGRDALQVAASFSMPLDPHTLMTIDGRAINSEGIDL